MIATQNQQQDLLSLANLDLEISRSKATITTIASGAQFTKLREQQRELAGRLIAARNQLDTVELELKRSEADLELVESRIKKDKERLASTNNAKDAQGIQSELESLARRKSDLEDIELAILDELEAAKAVFATVAVDKAAIDEELDKGVSAAEGELLKLRSGLDLKQNDRAKQFAALPAELAELYNKKASRGVPVARLIGRECGACRISLGASAFNEVESLARDEIATCPECQAILVR